MKTKTFSKKLSLNKKTVADLNNKDMQEVYGGASIVSRCDTNCCTITRCTECCVP